MPAGKPLVVQTWQKMYGGVVGGVVVILSGTILIFKSGSQFVLSQHMVLVL